MEQRQNYGVGGAENSQFSSTGSGRPYVESLVQEIEKLQRENEILKKYLVVFRNNASLKTANALAAILGWADGQLLFKFEDLCLSINATEGKGEFSILTNQSDQIYQPQQNVEVRSSPRAHGSGSNFEGEQRNLSLQSQSTGKYVQPPNYVQNSQASNLQPPNQRFQSSPNASQHSDMQTSSQQIQMKNDTRLSSQTSRGPSPKQYFDSWKNKASRSNEESEPAEQFSQPSNLIQQFTTQDQNEYLRSQAQQAQQPSTYSQPSSKQFFDTWKRDSGNIEQPQSANQDNQAAQPSKQFSSPQNQRQTIQSTNKPMPFGSYTGADKGNSPSPIVSHQIFDNESSFRPISPPLGSFQSNTPARFQNAPDQYNAPMSVKELHSGTPYANARPQSPFSKSGISEKTTALAVLPDRPKTGQPSTQYRSTAKDIVANQPSDWDELIYRPPEMINTSELLVQKVEGSPKKGSISLGYESQSETVPNYSTVSDGRARIGDPVGASTPKKGGIGFASRDTSNSLEETKSTKSSSKSGSSVLHRPIDQIINLKPVYTDQHRQKISRFQPNKRIIGEVAFQLDRRILEYVFSWKYSPETSQDKRRRFYGFTVNNIGAMIRKEATGKDGKVSTKKEAEMRIRMDYIIKGLSKFGYQVEKHSALTQDLVNKYGLLSGPPDRKTSSEMGLDDPVILRVLLSQLIKDDNLLIDVLVLLDCLCLLAHDDKRAIFLY